MDKAMHSEFEEQRAVVLTNIARPIVKNDLVAAFASDEDLLIYEHFFIRGMEHINYQVSELLEIIDNNNGVHSDSELETIKKCRSIPSESLRSELQKQKELNAELVKEVLKICGYYIHHKDWNKFASEIESLIKKSKES